MCNFGVFPYLTLIYTADTHLKLAVYIVIFACYFNFPSDMIRIIKTLWLIILLSFSITAYSQDTTSVRQRPKIGVVLSGGGAKGAAHIGVLKYIEEAESMLQYRTLLLAIM